jgi:hypothetical protein
LISNTRAAVSAYTEAIADGIQDQLRLRLFESIWAQGRNMSGAQEVRRVITDLLWPADPIYQHLISPDLPNPVLHDPHPMRIVRRSGGTVTPDGGPLTAAAHYRARQWRQQWLALPEPAIPAVIGPDGAIHAGPDGRLAKTELLARNAPRHGDAITPLVLAAIRVGMARHQDATTELLRLVLADPEHGGVNRGRAERLDQHLDAAEHPRRQGADPALPHRHRGVRYLLDQGPQ